MNRYQNITQTISTDSQNSGARVYETTMYPSIARSIDDIYFMSKIGDRLDIYADKYYNDTTLWFFIAQANRLGKGTMWVKPGIQIRIPASASVSKFQSDLNNLNS